MNDKLKSGIKNKLTLLPEEFMLTNFLDGDEVFSTPALVAFMEETCRVSILPFLDENNTSVGTIVNVKHLAATPRGMKVYSESELIEVDRRKCIFNVVVYDEKEKIGEAYHERFIVDVTRFKQGLKKKLS